MADRIHVLDEQVINRIAAGEVIERPVSVVKELVENSIDAGSSSIIVQVDNGGKKLILVRDDGRGISPDDAFLALERHATSKIRSEQDLVGVSTMGFRGEALAAIAAISKFIIKSCDNPEEGGQEIVAEGGVLKSAKPVGMPRGTIIEVRSLFYNVPVRRKFLRKTDLEEAHISELMTKFALGFPWIGFKYVVNQRVKMDAPPARSTFERIQSLYSKDVRDNLMEVDHSLGEVSIQGYVARPPYSRSNMRSVLTFVNGRSVKDTMINSAVNRAFSNLMERGRYPLAILFLQMPPDRLDINVHPQKAEVRFVDPKKVYTAIIEGVQDALSGGPFRPPPHMKAPFRPQKPGDFKAAAIPPPGAIPIENPRPQVPSEGAGKDGKTSVEKSEDPARPVPSGDENRAASRDYRDSTKKPTPNNRAQTSMISTEDSTISELGILGQLPNSFIVLYDEERLIVMDHHAAHERILFQDLLRAAETGKAMPAQTLLLPMVFQFDPVEAKILAQRLDLLNISGFIIEDFGENAFNVRGIPPWLHGEKLEEALNELIDSIMESGGGADSDKGKERFLKALACSSAAKETKNLRRQEIVALLKDLERVGGPQVCPHGRPIFADYTFKEIRKKLGRY
jgi:DNA mismatch repair protein MutL